MKAIIFDLDGTLIDTATTILNSIQLACQQTGIMVQKELLSPNLIGPPIAQIVKNLVPDISEEKCQQVSSAFRKIYDNCSHTETDLYPDIFLFLKDLKEKGKKMFICTNKPKIPTNIILENLSIKDFFEDILTIDFKENIKSTKTEMIHNILSHNNMSCVMVGDCISDIQAAHDNDIKGIAVTWGYEKDKEKLTQIADKTVKTIQELKEYLND